MIVTARGTKASARWVSSVLGALLLLARPAVAQVASTPPVNPENPRSAILSVTVSFTDTAGARVVPGRALVEARLLPGLDAAGQLHTVTDASLVVLGQKLLPVSTWTGVLTYRAELAIPATAFGRPFVITPPKVAGVEPPTPLDSLRGVGKLDAEEVLVPPGSALRLRVTGSGPLPTAQTANRWQLTLAAPNVHTLTAVGDGSPPDTLVVPANLLPRSAGPLLARFYSSALTGTISVPDDRYAVSIYLMTTLQWTVRADGAR